jgi:hypothetical protein
MSTHKQLRKLDTSRQESPVCFIFWLHAVLFAAGLLLGQTSISAGKKCYL